MSLSSVSKSLIAIAVAAMLAAFATGCSGGDNKSTDASNVPEDTAQVPGPAEGYQPETIDEEGVIGTEMAGAIKVPAGWESRASADYGERVRENSGMVYVVDPKTLTDAVDGGERPVYATSVKITYADGYTDISGDKNMQSYSDSGEYSDLKSSKVRFLGRDATIIEGTYGKTGSALTHIIFNYNDGRIDIEAYSAPGMDNMIDILGTWREYS